MQLVFGATIVLMLNQLIGGVITHESDKCSH
jgi:hypothetical protein